MTSLSDLAAALEAATGPSRELDERMAVEVFGSVPLGDRNISMNTRRRYTSDLKATWAAVDERWQPMRVVVSRGRAQASGATIVDGGARRHDGNGPPGDDGSIALCLAAVRLAEREAGDGR